MGIAATQTLKRSAKFHNEKFRGSVGGEVETGIAAVVAADCTLRFLYPGLLEIQKNNFKNFFKNRYTFKKIKHIVYVSVEDERTAKSIYGENGDCSSLTQTSKRRFQIDIILTLRAIETPMGDGRDRTITDQKKSSKNFLNISAFSKCYFNGKLLVNYICSQEQSFTFAATRNILSTHYGYKPLSLGSIKVNIYISAHSKSGIRAN